MRKTPCLRCGEMLGEERLEVHDGINCFVSGVYCVTCPPKRITAEPTRGTSTLGRSSARGRELEGQVAAPMEET